MKTLSKISALTVLAATAAVLISPRTAFCDDILAQNKPAQKQAPNQYKAIENEPEATSSGGDGPWQGKLFPQTNNFFAGAGLDYFDNFGLQMRYALRVLDKGFIQNITNPIYLEAGFGITLYGTKADQTGVTGFNTLITGRWDFQLDPNWTFFGDLGLGYNGVSNNRQSYVKGGGFFPAVGVGAIASLSSEWALRADLSYQFLGLGVLRRF